MRNSPRHLSHPSQSQGYWASLGGGGGKKDRDRGGNCSQSDTSKWGEGLLVSGEFLLRAPLVIAPIWVGRNP